MLIRAIAQDTAGAIALLRICLSFSQTPHMKLWTVALSVGPRRWPRARMARTRTTRTPATPRTRRRPRRAAARPAARSRCVRTLLSWCEGRVRVGKASVSST